MVPLPIQDFMQGRELFADLYIKLGEDKYIQIANQGELISPERIQGYVDRSITYLYISMESYRKTVERNLQMAGMTLKNASLPLDLRAKVLNQTAKVVLSEIEDIGMNASTYEHARILTEATLSIVQTRPDLTQLLSSLNDTSEGTYGHSIAVSAMCVMIGQRLRWEAPATLEKLALGGLLHDVGEREIPKEIIQKPRGKMTVDEVALYQTHPYRGMQILQSLGVVPDDVLSIVFEHHENGLGQGYPRRLRDLRMHPMAKVAAIADVVADLTVKGPNCPNPRKAVDALYVIENVMGQPFNKEVHKALKEIIKPHGFVKRAV